MADEQGLTEPDGYFARIKTGKAVKALLGNVGVDGRKFQERTSPPANPERGDVYLADGTNWDPDADGIAGGELVIYDGAGWVEIIGGL